MLSAESLEAIEIICQWMDESGIDWDSVSPNDKDD